MSNERIDHNDMLQRVQAAREGWMVPGAYLVQAHDDAQALNRIADELVAERDSLRQRLESAEKKLALVDEYGESQWHSGTCGTEFEAGPSETFTEWLAQREESLQPRA